MAPTLKLLYNLLILLFLGANSHHSHAQYIIEGSKYRSIRDSLFDNKEWKRKKDPINSISISGELTWTGPYEVADKGDWDKVKPLIDNYNGRKIKQVLVHHGTNKAVIVLKGKDSVFISEELAIEKGLLPNTAYRAESIIKVDTPLHVGSNIPVYIKLQHPENKLVSLQAGIRKTGELFQYELQSYLPGDVWVLEIGKDGRTKKVYAYTLLPDPEQKTDSPDFYAGELRSVVADYNLFKQQDKITVTPGYLFLSGSIYFTRRNPDAVQVVSVSGPSLGPAKPLLNLCFPGFNVMFDNVVLTDPAGEKALPMGKSYTLIDKDDIRANYEGLITSPHVAGGIMNLYRYIIETMIRLPHVDLNKGKFDFDLTFMLEADGTLTDILKKNFDDKDEMYKVCYDLVKHSNSWIPASYKGNKMRMPVNMKFSITIE